ncbi:venom allergen-1-like isoform X2 [Drosophila bipectinata]|uniref:venom allergen-1-like isoform X2 n=1 Tax=Drosophila bipectinata TaxID=42026 RepID=UPI0038B2ED75
MESERCIFMGAVIVFGFASLGASFNGNYSDHNADPNRFCRVKNCSPNLTLPHIGCNSTQIQPSSCGKDLKLHPMSTKLRTHIVNQHNIFRNLVASGMVNRIPGSGAMLKLRWDHDLEEVASHLVKRCTLHAPKECFSTSEYENPGFQSVYNKFKKAQNAFMVVKSQMYTWYEQNKHASVLNVVGGSSKNTDHFRRMMVGASSHVGCAVAMSQKDGWTHQWMTCLYSCSPKPDEPLYVFKGLSGEYCSEGVDGTFPNLCKESEPVEDCRLVAVENRSDATRTHLKDLAVRVRFQMKNPIAARNWLSSVGKLVFTLARTEYVREAVMKVPKFIAQQAKKAVKVVSDVSNKVAKVVIKEAPGALTGVAIDKIATNIYTSGKEMIQNSPRPKEVHYLGLQFPAHER